MTIGTSYFGWNLPAEPHFVDESAYISQSFYADLYWGGRWDHPAWLDYAGYDLPPLPKYLIGAALWADGQRRPSLTDAHAWYGDTSRQFVGRTALVMARRPATILGGLGCVAIFWVGTLALNARVGCIASFLLAINPLYHLHARRAMSDVPSECFILVGLALGLVILRWANRDRLTWGWWALVGLAGIAVGLATLAKLNGVLGGLVLASWAGVALGSRGISRRARAGLALAAGGAAAIAFATFVVLDPFLTAQPPPPVPPEFAPLARLTFAERVRLVYDHRANVSRQALTIFPHDALPTLASRAAVVAVQGFGRFGPLGAHGRSDSTRRFDRGQDWGSAVWLPVVAAGLILLVRRGGIANRHGDPPSPWLIVAYFGVVLVVVTAFIPLAWDRYLMSIQPAAALLGAAAIDAGVDRLLGRDGQRESAR